MTLKLHRCSGTLIKGPHPCWVAQSALDDAGIQYELVTHSPLRPLRGDLKALTGQKKLPLVEFEDGTFLRDSKVIAERARDGALQGPGERAPLG
jgi:Glutathione S-transferase, N-terminal domain